MPAVERTRVLDSAQIPRPPNSWILYRSDMVALLPPPAPGTTRSQADVSRMISRMWKNETATVKAEYERRAEVKKLEHAALYPGYRYTPKSKELKEEIKRSKEEKKRKRKQKSDTHEAPEPSCLPGAAIRSLPPFTSLPYSFLSADPAQYGQGGPSPPMSAAGSPSPEPFPHSQPIDAATERVNEHYKPKQTANSYYRPHTALPQIQPQGLFSQRPTQPDMTLHYLTAPDNSQTGQHSNDYEQPRAVQQEPIDQAESQQSTVVHSAPQQEVASTDAQDLLTFDFQQFAGQTLGNWALINPEFQPSLDQFLNNTSGDCYQMQIAPLDQFAEQPVGPLEVEVGNLDFNFLHNWDNSSLNMENLHSFFDNTPASNGGYDNALASSSSGEGSALSATDTDQTFHFDQFINFEPTFDYIPPTPVVEQAAEASTLSHAPYTPPSGAVHSGKRRVAASWNPSFAMAGPIDV